MTGDSASWRTHRGLRPMNGCPSRPRAANSAARSIRLALVVTALTELAPSPPLLASEEVRGAHGPPDKPGSTTTGGCTSPSSVAPTCGERSRLTPSGLRAQRRRYGTRWRLSTPAELEGHCPRLSIGQSPSSRHAHACRHLPMAQCRCVTARSSEQRAPAGTSRQPPASFYNH